MKNYPSFVRQMRKENDKALDDPTEYLSQPLYAFSLIRRMHQDWTHWEHYMKQPVGEQQVSYVQQRREELPTTTDLEEAGEALHRILVTYDLKVSDMAQGLLNGKKYKYVARPETDPRIPNISPIYSLHLAVSA